MKTKTSVRTVELPDVVAEPVRRLIDRGVVPVMLDDETDPRRPVRRETLLLFRSRDGEAVNSPTFSRTWSAARTKVGLPARSGIHTLRHYHATVLIHAGASVKAVQLALGHSSPIITLNTYVHEWPDAVDRTRSLIDGALGQGRTAAKSARSRA